MKKVRLMTKRRVRRVPNRIYTDLERRQGVIEYMIVGSIRQAAKNLGFNRDTMQKWKQTEWWQELVQEARDDIDDRMEMEQAQIIRMAHARVIDSLEAGDEKLVVDPISKKHVIKRVKPTGKEAMVMAAISTDKRRTKLNQPTSISANIGNMEELAAQFRKIAQDHDGYIKKEGAIKVVSEEINDN